MSFYRTIQYLVLVYFVAVFVMVGSDAASASKSTSIANFDIETDDAGSPVDPQIAFDTQGNALAVWSKTDGSRSNIWAKRYTVATNSWEAAVKIETDDVGNAYDPQIATDASGNALAVWSQNDGIRLNIWANRYIAAANSWSIPELIETNTSGHANNPLLTIDKSGNAIATWTENKGVQPQYWSNSYNTANAQWGKASMVDADKAMTAFYR
jgi:hypothetical protein